MIIGIIGHIGSGKDTVASYFVKRGCIRDSFACSLKDACAAVFGWPRELLEGDTLESREFRETPDMFWTRKLDIPNFTPRLALQLIGTDLLRDRFHEDIWMNSLEYRIRRDLDKKRNIVISDARFTNEIDLIRTLKGKIIWVQRGELPEWYDIAVSANAGNAISKNTMRTKYSDVHVSEWNWAGCKADYIIKNNRSLEDLNEQLTAIEPELLLPQLKAI